MFKRIRKYLRKGLECGRCHNRTNNRLINKAGGVCPNCGYNCYSVVPKKEPPNGEG